MDEQADLEKVLTAAKGDKSIFLLRDFLKEEDFLKKLPCLTLLLRTIQSTVEKQLSVYFTFDFALTTVQVEIYPGDVKSGYV
jgi:hypothetical protein